MDDEKSLTGRVVTPKRRFLKQTKNGNDSHAPFFSHANHDASTSSMSLTSLDDVEDEEILAPTYTIVGAPPSPLHREASLTVDDDAGSKQSRGRSKTPSRLRAFAEAVGLSSSESIDSSSIPSKDRNTQSHSVSGNLIWKRGSGDGENTEKIRSMDGLLKEIRLESEKQLQRKDDLKAIIEQLLDVANARLKTSNKIGAALTMKKIHKLQQERVAVSQVIEFLSDQESGVNYQLSVVMDQSKKNNTRTSASANDTSESYKKELQRILKQSGASSSILSDEELLSQLSHLAVNRPGR